jgi:predicted dehydrogenase
VSGRLEGGAEVSFLITTVPSNPSGQSFEIYGRDGTLTIGGGSSNSGPNRLQAARGKEPLAVMETPERFTLIPSSVPAGPPRNVAQAYARLARSLSSGEPFSPDFVHAVRRHKLLEAIERSRAEGRAISPST